MEGECNVVVDATVDTEVRKQMQQSAGPSSKLTKALLTFMLCFCAAAAVAVTLNMHTKSPGHTEDTSDLRHALRQIPNVRAAIHLEGSFNSDMNTSIQWLTNANQYHAQGGLKLVDNEIVIPHDGLYFVYSQASFSVSCISDDDDKSKINLSHRVERCTNSYGYETTTYIPILYAIRTACETRDRTDEDDKGNWYSTVYMGAVFNLNKGDKLRTTTEKDILSFLEREEGKNFFGVFAL